MTMPANVLVVFGPPTEDVESVAAPVAVGAVQARALIRLRRLDDAVMDDRIARSYVLPRSGDLTWADGVVLVTGAETDWSSFLGSLSPRNFRIGAVLSKGADALPLQRALEQACGRVLDTAEALARTDRSLANSGLLVGRWVGLSASSWAGACPFEDAATLLGPEHELD